MKRLLKTPLHHFTSHRPLPQAAATAHVEQINAVLAAPPPDEEPTELDVEGRDRCGDAAANAGSAGGKPPDDDDLQDEDEAVASPQGRSSAKKVISRK